MRRRDFRDLDVWKKGSELRKSIFELTQKFPIEEKYRLTDQIIRSSRSITANIVEGNGRYHYQENIQFCRMARGSLSESKEHLIVAKDCKYIEKEEFDKLLGLVAVCSKLLNGYINYLSRRKAASNS